MSSGTSSPYATVRALLALRGPADDPFDGDEVANTLAQWGDGDREDWWQGFVAEANHHGVALLLAPMLTAAEQARPGCIPRACRRAFAIIASRNRADAAAREACVDGLLAAFGDAGVTALLLKGAALAHMIYPDAGIRPMYDIDMLVGAADVCRAVAIAKRLGFEFAGDYASRFGRRHHHLPVATCLSFGQEVRLELHTDTLSRDRSDRLTLERLTAPPQAMPRGQRRPGQTLGHADMLVHLCAHAFEPARFVRLIHLYDVWRYRARYRDQVDWAALAYRHPGTAVALEMACLAFDPTPAPEAGCGMVPLTEIASTCPGVRGKLAALLDPPGWWLRGFYGVPAHRSLLPCRVARHPATVLRWLARRALSVVGGINPPRVARESRSP